MSSLTATTVGRDRRPFWFLKFVDQDGSSEGWTLYQDGSRFALAKKTDGEPEYHLFEKHTAVLNVDDRSKHRLLWKGSLTRAGREYISHTLALSNAAGRILRVDGKAQCTQCRKLIILKEFESHPCKENDDE